MYNFTIYFIRESNGAAGKDTFTELTENEARSSFKACYRHDNYKITKIEKSEIKNNILKEF